MIILNNMYTGRYISSWGKLGHEAINLIKSDNGNFYIWLNSMGIFPSYKVNQASDCTIIMVRSVNSRLYKVLAYAKKCNLCNGATISRKKKNSGAADKKARYDSQKTLKVTYNGKCPMDDIYKEEDMFATFVTDEVYETDGDIYLTNDVKEADENKKIFYADFAISEAMRSYIEDSHSAKVDLENLIAKATWKKITGHSISSVRRPEFNFFKLIRKEKDEISISNALAYFIDKTSVKTFLDICLKLASSIISDNYLLLREKNNIDISFFGEENVVIIENKIDAGITCNGRITIVNQMNRAVELYYDDSFGTKEEYKDCIYSIVNRYRGDASQLSKYYIYAIAYLLTKGVDPSTIEDHIKCFLLIPEYSKNNFKSNSFGFYVSDFRLSEKYKIITYKDILEFFSKNPIIDPYFNDFISVLKPLAYEFNNELEQEMKYRFLHAIGAI